MSDFPTPHAHTYTYNPSPTTVTTIQPATNLTPPKMLTQQQLATLCPSIWHALPAEFLALRSSKELHNEALATLNQHLARCEDLSFANSLHASIGLATPPDYLNRIITFDHQLLLCAIRFFAGSPLLPFVEILAWSSTTTPHTLNLPSASAAALQAFALFNPRAVRFMHPGTPPPPLTDQLQNWSIRGDQVLCAATLESICKRPLPPNFDRIDLIDINLDQALAFMEHAYAHLRATQPFLASRVPPAPREGMIECFEHGRLCFWRLDGQTAGIIAVKPQLWHGLDGYLVEEEIVNPAHNGLGTASVAQRHLAESLTTNPPHSPQHAHRTLFGSIDCANPASRRTAARIGRQELATWWFLSPPDCKI